MSIPVVKQIYNEITMYGCSILFPMVHQWSHLFWPIIRGVPDGKSQKWLGGSSKYYLVFSSKDFTISWSTHNIFVLRQWFSSGWMLELQEVLQWEYGSAAIGKVSTLEESSMKCIYLHIWLILHMYLRFVVRIRCVYLL